MERELALFDGGVLKDPVLQLLLQENQQEILSERNFLITHVNKLIKQIAKDTEKVVLEKYAGVHGSIPSAVLQEISVNMLESSFPGQIASASSAGAIKMKLWRQKQVGNPHPKIPKTHTEYIETNELPDTLCKTADGADFLFYKERIGEEESVAFFMSQWGVDVLKSHKIWLFDGTFSSAPVPFA